MGVMQYIFYRKLFNHSRLFPILVFGIILYAATAIFFYLTTYKLTHDRKSRELIWIWQCNSYKCIKIRASTTNMNNSLSFASCNIICEQYAGLWPKPTGNVKIERSLISFNPNSIVFPKSYVGTSVSHLVKFNVDRFLNSILKLTHNRETKHSEKIESGRSLLISLNIENKSKNKLSLNAHENYTLEIQYDKSNNNIEVVISASTIFGARHGLETLTQLIIYDDIKMELQILKKVSISDGPAFPYRGLLLDTSRHYISVSSIKRTIEGMALNKLNTFHWHITDYQSFPYVLESHPEFSRLGAYSPNDVYKPKDVAEIVDWGLKHGIRVMPELDTPSHVGEGWQDTGVLTCFKAQPWQYFCSAPPCGQLDPTKDKTYDILQDIYGDIVEQFEPDIFHMGGDEVSVKCWNATESIVEWMAAKGWGRNEEDFMKLWYVFQDQALGRFNMKVKKDIPIIMWTSKLTQPVYIEKYLPKDRYIIQIWNYTGASYSKEILEKGYRVILSNFDVWFLDCGFSNWIGDGHNWCSPFNTWHKVYDHDPTKIVGYKTDLILGGEAALWTEQADDFVIDSRLWPRTAALAERLWANPETNWTSAESRMIMQRERLIVKGIHADVLQPFWCYQNQGLCRT